MLFNYHAVERMQFYSGSKLTLSLQFDLEKEALVNREKVTEFKQ